MATPVPEQLCPDCGAPVPQNHGYISWCDSCGWNLSAPVVEQPQRPAGRLYASIGRRMGDRLAAQLIDAKSLEPRLTAGRVAAYAIAVGVFVLTLVLLVGGVLLAVVPFPNVFAIVVGVCFVLVAIEMRPRFGKVPTEHVLTRDEAPRLHALVEEVAAALETKPPDLIVLDTAYNASWVVVGLRRRRVLTLGLPLFVSLAPQERVGLIAHELAHGRNGDSGRGFVVGSALGGLGALYTFLAPGSRDVSGAFALFDGILDAVFWVLSRPVLGVLSLEWHLVLRDSQRAEYYADALAASVAGADAEIAGHEKLLLTPLAHGIARKAATGRSDDVDVFAEIAHAVADVPERERERRRRVARLQDARLDDTHPPTALRIRLIEERPRTTPKVTLSPAESEAIDRELERRRRPLQEELLDAERDRLYAR